MIEAIEEAQGRVEAERAKRIEGKTALLAELTQQVANLHALEDDHATLVRVIQDLMVILAKDYTSQDLANATGFGRPKVANWLAKSRQRDPNYTPRNGRG